MLPELELILKEGWYWHKRNWNGMPMSVSTAWYAKGKTSISI